MLTLHPPHSDRHPICLRRRWTTSAATTPGRASFLTSARGAIPAAGGWGPFRRRGGGRARGSTARASIQRRRRRKGRRRCTGGSRTTRCIGQAGRRGALMITIADSHPDVLDFVKVKRNLTKVRYANISVRVSDAFMRAVESDREFPLGFANEHAEVSRMIRARDLWSELIKGARDYAEPGLIFWDQIKYWSTSEYNGMGVITTNPCSEIPLEPYGNCCLGNVNMACFVSDPFGAQPRVDWERLEPALRAATRFLDNVLEYNADKHPLPAQKAASLKSRRIGVGFTGLGDMLIKLGLKYDTDEAVGFVDQLFERIKNVVYDESVNLACEKGVFPAYDADKHLAGR